MSDQQDAVKENGIEVWLSENASQVMLWVLAIALVIIVVIAVAYFAFFLSPPLSIDPATLGQAGDFFGGLLNPALSFLSVFALLVALVIQTRELKLSREALKVSQEELVLTREEQAKAAQALASQNKAIQRQSFEQTFFAWLGTYRQILGEITYAEEYGREALKHIWRPTLCSEYVHSSNQFILDSNQHLSLALSRIGEDSLDTLPLSGYPVIAKATANTWDELYKSHETQLDSFFRVLYRLLKWIDEQPRELLGEKDKWLYVGIVRAQLSWIEMVYLFYNGMTTRGANFKTLIERYALFDNLTIDSDRLLVILKECPMDSKGYSVTAYNSDMARLC